MGLNGFQKPIRKAKTRQVRIPVLSSEGDWIICSCGWASGAARKKVREDAAERHLNKKHEGKKALWT